MFLRHGQDQYRTQPTVFALVCCKTRGRMNIHSDGSGYKMRAIDSRTGKMRSDVGGLSCWLIVLGVANGRSFRAAIPRSE